MSLHSYLVDTDKYLMHSHIPSSEGGDIPFDLEYVDVASAKYTLIAGAVSAAIQVPIQGFGTEVEPGVESHVLYLDAHGAEPGVWVAPLP
ncbi:MAG TPA: hypothetical protein VGB85_25760, partial [Nannocystis sp.]|jgi:hypothetical protein